MENINFREVSQIKNSPSLLLKALFASPNKSEQIPKIGIKAKLGVVAKEKAIPFLKVCDNDLTSNEIPSVYLHILGSSLHMELLTDKAFPYKLLGIVHVASKIKKYNSISFGDNLDIEVYFGNTKTHDKGVVISLIQKIYRSGSLVWEEELEFLKRKSNPNTSNKKKTEDKSSSMPIDGENEIWILASDLGRRYGKISGDINPIHLYPLTAKLFGFKRHIIHGFWTIGRTMASLESKIEGNSYQVDCVLKLPIFLPNKVRLNYKKSGSKIEFEVRDSKNEKPHMVGEVQTNR